MTRSLLYASEGGVISLITDHSSIDDKGLQPNRTTVSLD